MKRLTVTLIILLVTVNNSLPQVKQNIVHPDWSKNVSIYEVNIRQFTPEGTLKAFSKHLPRLMKLGVDILWLMPINPIGELNRKGTLGSYYSIKDYKAVNKEFGTPEDFSRLVNQIHKLGMKVIIDWVANHTSWDNAWTKTHPDFFTTDDKGNFVPSVPDWTDVIDLNYDNKELHEYMIDAMKYWVKEFNIDGFRCDVAAMVPTEFWLAAIPELRKQKNVFMLAEASENYLHQVFDMTYNWQLKDLMNDIVKEKKKAADLKAFFENETKEYKTNDYRMNFTTNHDENSWSGTEYERLGDGVKAFTVLCGTVPGMPLIYSGQESGLNKRLRFFDKDTILWKENEMNALFAKLNSLKKKNRALWNGENGGALTNVDSDNENVFSFVRSKKAEKVFTVFNFSNQPQKVTLRSNEISGKFVEYFSNTKKVIASGTLELQMKPWEYLVFVR